MFNDVILVERNGIVFKAHWRYRFDPIFGGGDSPKMPVVESGNPKRTAETAKQLTEQAKKNKALAMSLITRDWSPPKLSQKGLLGLKGTEL